MAGDSNQDRVRVVFEETPPRKHRTPGPLDVLRALGDMVRDPDYHFPTQFKLYLVLGLLYILSPIDIMPELIFGPLGVVDDLGVFVLLLRMLYGEAADYIKVRDSPPR